MHQLVGVAVTARVADETLQLLTDVLAVRLQDVVGLPVVRHGSAYPLEQPSHADDGRHDLAGLLEALVASPGPARGPELQHEASGDVAHAQHDLKPVVHPLDQDEQLVRLHAVHLEDRADVVSDPALGLEGPKVLAHLRDGDDRPLDVFAEKAHRRPHEVQVLHLQHVVPEAIGEDVVSYVFHLLPQFRHLLHGHAAHLGGPPGR
mmetsp:Transcript_171062/g.548189  ORF Transcript_171062/g.548189 Transcript_171062/m.548189 type:complete len:205 (+) Transcript_171062:364-978(+)